MMWNVPGRSVFISHTSELRQYPAEYSYVDAAVSAVVRAGHVPVLMDYFAASNASAARKSHDEVENSDVFVAVVGFKYGSVVPSRPGVSYCELETDTAARAGIPRLMFVLNDSATGPQSLFRDLEFGQLQERFRQRLTSEELTLKYISSPTELELSLYQSLVELESDRTRESLLTTVVPSEPYYGRSELVNALTSEIRRLWHAKSRSIHTLSGMAGIGKSALAREVCRRVIDVFPDGVIWLDAAGYTPDMKPLTQSEILNELLIATLPEVRIEARTAPLRLLQWVRLASNLRALVVLDNVSSMDQIEAVVSAQSLSCFLVTSRRILADAPDARQWQVPAMDAGDAFAIYRSEVTTGADEEFADATTRELLEACGGLPLAVKIAARLVQNAVVQDRADVLDALVGSSGAVFEAGGSVSLLRKGLTKTFEILPAQCREVAASLAHSPIHDISQTAISAVSGVGRKQAQGMLRELVLHNVLERVPSPRGLPGGPRFAFHDLTAAFLRSKFDAVDETVTGGQNVITRLVLQYLRDTQLADRMLRPHVYRSAAVDPARDDCKIENREDAQVWLIHERTNLMRLVGAAPQSRDVAELCLLAAFHFRDFGFWADVRTLYQLALEAGQVSSQPKLAADGLRGLGDVAYLFGRFAEARSIYSEALDLAVSADAGQVVVDALWGLGDATAYVGELPASSEFYRRAEKIAMTAGDFRGVVLAKWGLGHNAAAAGDVRLAFEEHRAALAIATDINYAFGRAEAHWGLGEAALLAGYSQKALGEFEASLGLAHELRDRRGSMLAMWGLGEAELMLGRPEAAAVRYRDSIRIAEQLDDTRGIVLNMRGLGEVNVSACEFESARKRFLRALDLAQGMGWRAAQADLLLSLASVGRLTDDSDAARHQEQAASIVRAIGYVPRTPREPGSAR